MKRDLYKTLLKWKAREDRMPLIVQGARQVGKTWILKHFGSQEFKKVCVLNFEETPKAKFFFDSDLDPERILRDLGIHFETKIDSDTLLIFDEIQECPNALTSLKYFCEKTPQIFIAAAGSLLGVKLAGAHGFPVGKVQFCHLYPLSFFEFLDAMGRSMLRELLEGIDSCEPIAKPHHEQLIELLKTYLIVGGMPKVVSRFANQSDFQVVRETQEDILKSYVHDFAKHAPPAIVMKITQIWDSIPVHLGKENKKFIFSAVKKSARARDYEEALQWLLDAALIYKIREISTPKIPLESYNDHDAFKIYLFDVGLLSAMCRIPPRILLEGDQLFTEFKGSLTENYVCQSLIAATESPLFYWTSEREAEVDFVLEYEGQLLPLEVKSGTSTKKKSLLIYQDKYRPPYITRSSLMNLNLNGSVCNYPLYLISRFPKILDLD